MAPPDSNDLLDEGMLARLERANAKSYEQLARQNEKSVGSSQDVRLPPPEVRESPAGELRQSRARPRFVYLIMLLLAPIAFVTALAWDSDAVKLFARWGHQWGLSSLQQARISPPNGIQEAGSSPPDVAQRLQKMSDDLANIERQIEQLKNNQEQTIRSEAAVVEQLKTSQQQIVQDNAKAIEQLNAARMQTESENAAIAKQLKANQEQLATLASSRAARAARKRLQAIPAR